MSNDLKMSDLVPGAHLKERNGDRYMRVMQHARSMPSMASPDAKIPLLLLSAPVGKQRAVNYFKMGSVLKKFVLSGKDKFATTDRERNYVAGRARDLHYELIDAGLVENTGPINAKVRETITQHIILALRDFGGLQ